MKNWTLDGVTNSAVDCLLSCSSSSYAHVQHSRPSLLGNGAAALSGWDDVMPNAEYDFCCTVPNAEEVVALRRRRRHSSSRSIRGVVSMPNLCTRFKQTMSSQMEHYVMSGYLDEDFSYVYREGLSDRCRADIERNKQDSSSTGNVIHLQKKNLSTCNLTLDPTSLSMRPLLVERKQYNEVSKIISMQFRPEVEAEQKLIENRLGMQRSGDGRTLEKIKHHVHTTKATKICSSTCTSSTLNNGSTSCREQPPRRRKQRHPRPKPLQLQTHWYPKVTLTQDPHQHTDVVIFNGYSQSQPQTLRSRGSHGDTDNAMSTPLGYRNGLSSVHKKAMDESLLTPAATIACSEKSRRKSNDGSGMRAKWKWTNNGVVTKFKRNDLIVHVDSCNDERLIEKKYQYVSKGSLPMPYFIVADTEDC